MFHHNLFSSKRDSDHVFPWFKSRQFSISLKVKAKALKMVFNDLFHLISPPPLPHLLPLLISPHRPLAVSQTCHTFLHLSRGLCIWFLLSEHFPRQCHGSQSITFFRSLHKSVLYKQHSPSPFPLFSISLILLICLQSSYHVPLYICIWFSVC